VINPYSAFDALAISVHMRPSLRSLAFGEMQLLSYLSCLLSLYRGQPVSDWGYRFTGTRDGSPFSPELSDALSALSISGSFKEELGLYELTDHGHSEYTLLRGLTQNSRREIYITGACSATLSLPIGLIRQALLQEPALKRTTTLGTARALLEGRDLEGIYQQFSVLSSAIGVELDELMIPAVSWLSWLLHSGNTSNSPSPAEDADA
jgi:hypothetical protein